MEQHKQQDAPAAVYSLAPGLTQHVFRHLSKWDKQQFALCCKHTYLCSLAAVTSLVLSHKCLLVAGRTTPRLKTVCADRKHAATGVCWPPVALMLTRVVVVCGCRLIITCR